MRISPFPLPPALYTPSFMARVLDNLRVAFSNAVGTTEAAPFVLLQSPAGKVYKVTVSDTGSLTTTEVPLGP
jgi:hypothetical protein